MNQLKGKFLCIPLTLLLVLSFASIFTTFAQEEKPKIAVTPAEYMFETDDMAVGDTFVVDVMAVDWLEPGLFALSFELHYDNTILEAVSISPNGTFPYSPPDHFMVPGTNWPPGEWSQGGLYVVVEGTGLWHEEGYAALALTVTGAEPGHVGTGTIAQITFMITAEPAGREPLSCLLELVGVTLSDPTPAKIPATNYDVEHGYYEFSPPKPPVFLKVEPETAFAAEASDRVILDVTINNCTAELEIIGVQFKLKYNTTLLEVIDVTEGDFMKGFAAQSGSSTYFIWHDDSVLGYDYAVIGVLIRPDEAGINNPPFPEGDGTLATIEFQAKTIPSTRVTTDLLIEEVKIIDTELNLIPPHHLEHGSYKVPALQGDLNFDDKVDIDDVAIAGKAWGSYPGHPRWNPSADLVRDNRINILDIALVAKHYGEQLG